jgi:trk system potassium uptake protein TrkH
MEKTQAENTLKRKKRMPPAAFVILGFISVILAGALFLCLPVSSRSGEFTSFTDSFFTSVNSVCVTGMSVVETGAYFSGFGQAVIFILMQIGGLGFMTVTTLVLILIRKKIKLRDKAALQASLGIDGKNFSILKTAKGVAIFTVSCEVIGAVLLMPVFIRDFGGIGVWHSFFTAASSFCNAGMTVFTGFYSLTKYASDPYVCLVVAALVFLGGLGFLVVNDIVKTRGRFKKLTLHSKIVLTVTLALTLSGFLFFLGSEFNHPSSLGKMGGGTKVLAALVESVSARTAGFSVIAQNGISHAGKFMRDILSFIGASPGGTGGGIKTTALAVLITAIFSGFRKKDEIVIFKRSVNHKTVYRAVSVLVTAFALIAFLTAFLLFSEKNAPAGIYSFENILHEAIGAFSTSGVSCGLTPFLSTAGKYATAAVIFMGRVGILPVTILFTSDEGDILKYPEAHVPIG